jgi:hypothetical protein
MSPARTIRLDTPARRGAATAVAALTWGALLLQLTISLQLAEIRGQGPALGLVIYLGFFTVVANLLVALSLSLLLAAPGTGPGRMAASPRVATALAAGILFVGVAYHGLLGALFDVDGLQRIAHLWLHYVTPALYLVFWFLFVPKGGLRLAHIPRWTLYPLAYGLYVLVRGELTGLYPYPFVDVDRLGYARVALHTGMILGSFMGLAAVLVTAGRALDPGDPAR